MRRTALLLGLIVAGPVQGGDAPKAPPGVDRFVRAVASVRRFPEVAISRDGSRVAYVLEEPAADGGAPLTSLQVTDARGTSGARRINVGGANPRPTVKHPAWSFDGQRLAFLSDAEAPGQLQLYVATMAGTSSAQRVTAVKGVLAHPLWSRSGSVAVLFTENARGPVGPTAAKAPDVGVIEESLDVQRIAIVDLAARAVRMVSPPGLYVHEYDWSPDASRFVATAAPPPGDDTWYVAELLTIDAAKGEARTLVKPELQVGCPRFSPDGRSVAFIAGLMSDEGVLGGEVFVVEANGGEARNLTPDRDASPSFLAWLSSSKELLVVENAEGGSGVVTVSLDGKPPRLLWRGSERLSGPPGLAGPAVSVAEDGRATAVVRQSFARAPEVWAGPVGEWRALTRANDRAEPCWGRAESLTWRNEGFSIQGWLVHPGEEAAGRLYPLIVEVHGGPASAVLPSWPAGSALAHACDGSFVLLPNPRGSHGRGQAFVRANVKDLGGGDLRDILAGLDEVVKTRAVDERRLGIQGWSYGGFMTMWTVTQTKRFRAAVAGAGISNWQSYYGQNGIARWMLPYFGASVYDDPAVYAKSSPMNFIKNVTAPTLVLVGERDIECPPPQSFEFWRGLRARGVPTSLVVYAGEGHGIGKPENRRDVLRRTLAWFRDHLGES